MGRLCDGGTNTLELAEETLGITRLLCDVNDGSFTASGFRVMNNSNLSPIWGMTAFIKSPSSLWGVDWLVLLWYWITDKPSVVWCYFSVLLCFITFFYHKWQRTIIFLGGCRESEVRRWLIIAGFFSESDYGVSFWQPKKEMISLKCKYKYERKTLSRFRSLVWTNRGFNKILFFFVFQHKLRKI